MSFKQDNKGKGNLKITFEYRLSLGCYNFVLHFPYFIRVPPQGLSDRVASSAFNIVLPVSCHSCWLRRQYPKSAAPFFLLRLKSIIVIMSFISNYIHSFIGTIFCVRATGQQLLPNVMGKEMGLRC